MAIYRNVIAEYIKNAIAKHKSKTAIAKGKMPS